MKVVRLIRERSLGNSVTLMCNKLREQHAEKWLERGIQYMTECTAFLPYHGSFPELPPQPTLPQPRWLMAVYLRDVLRRVDDVEAKLTSTFGTVLKLDSTKKITRKLAGRAAGTAQWATDVGNEFGQVLACVLTTAEGAGLREMTNGLMTRSVFFAVRVPC